jgi:hypothetical protein
MYRVHCLVADELAAAAREDWRASDQAREVLLLLAEGHPRRWLFGQDAQFGEPNRKFRVQRLGS